MNEKQGVKQLEKNTRQERKSSQIQSAAHSKVETILGYYCRIKLK